MRKLTVFLGFMLVAACTTGEKMGDIHEGMSQAEVTAQLGNPDGFQRMGGTVALRYTNKLISGWSWDRADYYVILKDDQTVEWGSGTVRQNQITNTLILVPIQ